MKKLLCLLLTLLLIHPVLAEDALDAPDAASLLSCADGTVLAVSPDLRVLRRDTAGNWALVLSAEQISAACPPRFMPDAANALLLPGENGAYALLLLPDTSGQIAVLSLTGATCELTRVFADFLPTDSEMTAQWTLLSAARAGNTLYAAFSSNFATYSTYALSLADGSSFLLSDAPIRFLMPLADGQLLACVNPPISSIDESCFALLDADSGESSRLCALPAHKAYAGFALDGDSLYFTDGETIYCAAPPYDAVESVGYLPSLDTNARLPALMVDNCYCVCNAELGFFAAQLHTAPRCTLRVDARLSNVNRALVSQYLRAHPDVAVVYAPHNASTAPEYRQHMESGGAEDSGRRSALHAVPRHPVPLGAEAGGGCTGGRARSACADSAGRIQRGGNRNVSCAPESRVSTGIVVLGQRRPACIHLAAAPSGRRMHRGDVRAGIDPHCADDDT